MDSSCKYIKNCEYIKLITNMFNIPIDWMVCKKSECEWRDKMKNKELFDRANAERDLKLQAKLRNDFAEWCKRNGRTLLNPRSLQDWWNEDVKWECEKK